MSRVSDWKKEWTNRPLNPLHRTDGCGGDIIFACLNEQGDPEHARCQRCKAVWYRTPEGWKLQTT